MDLFDVLALIGGLCLFLFGMNIMGDGLERRAGNSLKALLGKLTDSKIKGFLTGLGVTAVIQSSSATTVMVVGFVNSRLMTLKQSIGVIMGANIGTTVTAWILSLGGISSDNLVMQLLKPTSFTPVLALLGTILYMFSKEKINPMIGAAGISAFPMSARVVHKLGLEEDNQNFLLMHSIGVNVSGQIASVIAGGLILALVKAQIGG